MTKPITTHLRARQAHGVVITKVDDVIVGRGFILRAKAQADARRRCLLVRRHFSARTIDCSNSRHLQNID